MFRRHGGELLHFVLLSLACTLLVAASNSATATDDEYLDLVGEWSGVWPGPSYDRSAIIVHEVDSETSKARITFLTDRLDTGRERHEIVADFVPSPVPTIKFSTTKSDFTCAWRKRTRKLDVSYEGAGVRSVKSNSCLMEKRQQIFSNVEKLLEENPMPEGKKSHAIKISENENATVYLVRSAAGAGLEPHFHASHDETLYVIKGSGQLLVDGKWVELQPGSVHFNPLGKPHANKQVGTEDLITMSIFTPGMKDPDRHFVQK